MKTPFEWVEIFNDRIALNTDEHNSLVSLFAQAINEAVEAEREACAKVVRDKADKQQAMADETMNEDMDEGEAYEHSAWMLNDAANAILARSKVTP